MLKTMNVARRQSKDLSEWLIEILIGLAFTEWGRQLRVRAEIYLWQAIARGTGFVCLVKPYLWAASFIFVAMFVLGYLAAMLGF